MRFVMIAVLVVLLPAAGFAQDPAAQVSQEVAPRPESPNKFEILDNSFFIEEAFNQDRGIFQNIFSWARDRSGQWSGNFTQEWPAPTIRHQLSYTIPFVGGASPASFGGVLLNYRYQVTEEAGRRPALAPRFSVILPTGRAIDDSDRPGVQFNIPVSKQVGNFYVHANAGATWLHGVRAGETSRANLTSPSFGGSVIWNTQPALNLMLESVLTLQDTVTGNQATSRQRVATISPGARGGWTRGDRQFILGAAAPFTFAEGEPRATAFLIYVSYELPFSSNR